jgi:hypothetical protein
MALPLRFNDHFGAGLSVTHDFAPAISRIAVGAPEADDECDSGAIWLIDVDAGGTPTSSTRVTVDGLGDDAAFGSSLGWLGDLDQNGTVELAVTAPAQEDYSFCAQTDIGEVWVVSIDAAGAIVATQSFDGSSLGASPDTNVAFGRAVAAVGDLDGDGVTELAVGVNTSPSSPTASYYCEGSVWILFLASDGSVKQARQITTKDPGVGEAIGENAAVHSFGDSLGATGDLDGNDVPDLAIGAPRHTTGPGETRGAVFIVYLDAEGGVVHARRFADETSNITTTSNTFHETSTTFIPIQRCGDGDWDGRIDASDALWALTTAIGLRECDVCDIDCSDNVTARDALLILKAVVGAVPIACAC